MEGKSGNADYKPPSVAELAGKFKKQTSSTPSTGKEEKRICPPVQKRPPCSLNLQSNVLKEEMTPNSEEKRVCPPVHKKPPCCLNLQNNAKEKVSHKAEEKHVCPPVHKKPPCSLNLQAYMAKGELSPNGEEKAADGGISQASKVKSKLSPGIGKLQTNLNFDPAALRPGGSPKSPGLKLVHSPNISPASTPTTPPTPTTLSQPIQDEVPAGFENPPEGAPLQSFNKGRTRLSMKRRPPSRKHRRSVTDDTEDIGIIDTKDKTAESSEKVAVSEEKISTTQEEKPLQEQPQAGEDSSRNKPDIGPAEEVLEDSGVFVEEKKKAEDEKTPSKDVEETGEDEPDGTVTCQEAISDENASQSQEPICQDLSESSEVVSSESLLENKETTGQTTDDCSPVNEQNSEKKPDMEVASTQDTEN